MTPEQFKKRCKDLNYSGPQMAKRLGVARSTVYKWEQGTHDIPDTVAELMKYIEPLPKSGT